MKYIQLDEYKHLVIGVYDYKPTIINTIEVDSNPIVGQIYVDGEFYDLPQTLSYDDIKTLSDDEIKSKILEEQQKSLIQNYLNKLIVVCDEKTKQVESYINGFYVTDIQLFRYQQKFEMAQQYLMDKTSYKDELGLEADLTGKTVDSLANDIVDMGNTYDKSIKKYCALIEAFRIKTKQMLLSNDSTQIQKAIQLIDLADGMNFYDMSYDDIKNIFIEN